MKYITFENPNRSNLSNQTFNKVFNFYLQNWIKVINSLGSKNEELENEFFDATRIYALFDNDEVVGIHIGTEYEKPTGSKYWNTFSDVATSEILKNQTSKIQVISHFLVNEDFLKKDKANLAITRIILGLTLKNQEFYNNSCSVTVARRDIGVHSMFKKFGAYELDEPQEMHNVPVSTMSCLKPNYDVINNNILFHQLWNERQIVKFKNIKDEFTRSVDKISEIYDQFPFENKAAAAEYFSQQLHLIKNSTRYLAACASLIDPDNSKEFNEWSEYLKEEQNHDLLLKTDLKNLGFSNQFEIYPETRALVATVYHDIQKHSPYCLFGYALMLEGLSLLQCGKLYDTFKANHGISSAYFKVHADADEKHFPQGIKKVESLPFETQQRILDTLDVSVSLYSTILEKAKFKYSERKIAA